MIDTAVIACGDLHVNSTVAVCPPVVELDDGGTYHASRVQRWLWDCWLDQVEKVKAIEARRKVLILNGDIGELDTKRRSNQLISANKSTILSTVLKTISPLVDVVDDVIIIRGTQAHVGKAAWVEEMVAADLDHTIKPTKKDAPASWYHLRGVFAGVRFDVAHHVSMGHLPWSEKNAANKIASIVLWRYLVDMGQPAPHVVIRSHQHRYNDSGGNYPLFVVLMSAWTVGTEFLYRIGGENSVADIGSSIFYCDNAQFRHERMKYQAKEANRRVWQAM